MFYSCGVRGGARSRCVGAWVAMAASRGLCVWAIVMFAGWVVGRVFTDRWGWSQWVWWVPSVAWIAGGLVGLIGAGVTGRVARAGRRGGVLFSVAAGLVVVMAGYVAVVDWHMARVFSPARSADGDVGVVFWNPSWNNRGEAAAPLVAIESNLSQVSIIANPPPGAWGADFRSRVAPDEVHSLARFVVITEFEVVRSGAIWLGMAGRVPHPDRDRDPEARWALDPGAAAFVELDTTAELGRPIVVWMIDLPSDVALHRMEVAERARERIDSWNGEGFPAADLIVGDFNIPRGSASLRRIVGDAVHAFDQAGHGYPATWPRALPLLHIDHVFCAGEMRATSYGTVDPGVRDHRLVRLTVRAGERGVR